MNTVGFDEMIAEVERTEWADIYKHSGLSPEHLEKLAKLFLESERSIFCWGMGITQHRHGTANVHMLANLLLARGQIGRPGAGLCPVRGHSNVQGDRTMGINELPSPKLLDNIDRVFGIKSPRKMGMVSLKLLKPWQKVRSKSLLVWVGTLQLQRQIRRIPKKHLESVI